MSLPDVTSARSSPAPDTCPECDTSASVTSDLHKYQVACTCKPSSAAYARADDPGPLPPAKPDTPPALPPRPPANLMTNRRNNASVNCNTATCRRRKYAWWCVGCGALAAALGGLLAAQHILLRAYTASPQHLETVPAAVPAAMLVLTGVCIMSLARRRNRYSYMIKVVGACCLVCALTCVLVTITTTVIHMNKLQTLKFCLYTKLTRTCTCYSVSPDSPQSSKDEGIRCVFEGVSECDVVHGALYWCLRGVFALSVCAVLVCIFSCMLAYQLLSHERKKMYWEQLELRCRSLYRPPTGPATAQPRAVQASCACCARCRPAAPAPAWDGGLQHRFWAPGRIGNLYSPNPGTVRKTSAWSWFPWPRSNSQNSRCRMGVPQSGDSAYGFCETETPTNPQGFEEQFPANFQTFQRNQGTFQNSGTFQNYPAQGQGYQEQYQAEGCAPGARGAWGPPPPYSPHGRAGAAARHQPQQDPAAAALLQRRHVAAPRDSGRGPAPHACRASYMLPADPDLRQNPDMRPTENIRMTEARINPDMVRLNPDIARMNPELIRNNELIRADLRMNPDIMIINPDIRMNADMMRNSDIRMNQELAHLAQMYPPDELVRLQEHLQPEARFSTLRGHLVPYPCQRTLAMSAGNLHRDCRMDENVTIECLHQKSASKVSDQSSDSCQNIKQGKENLGFQNDKHSPIRASMQDCHRGNQNAESEVYFADVSSCCNVSVKADCCMNPPVSALVGTIENQPESTSESDSGSCSLARQQRAQPPPGPKRRARPDKHKLRDVNMRLTEQQIEQLNALRMNERMIMNDSRVSEREFERDSRMCDRSEARISDRMNETRMSERDSRMCDRSEARISDRMNETRMSERDSRMCDRSEARISDRMNETRMSERDSRMCDRSEARISDRMNETRMSERDSRIIDRSERAERMNDSRISDRMNDSRISDRMNETRMSERENSRISDRMNETRISERVNDSRLSDRLNETRMSERLNDSRISDRLNETRMSGRNDSRDRLNDSRIERDRIDTRDRMNDVEGSPKMRLNQLRMPRFSPKLNHPRQSSIDSNKAEFFVPPPPNQSLSPTADKPLLSEDSQVYSNEPDPSKCLGPDSQYESVKEKEELKTNHHHCYSDTNTMDSGWQSGSEKQVTD